MDMPQVYPQSKLLLTFKDVQHMLSLGRNTVYELVKANELRSVKVGTAHRIYASSVFAYVNRLLGQD